MLYNLIIRLKCNKCEEGLILCSDRKFIEPINFKSSGKTAVGYAINDHTVVSLKRAESTYSWNEARSYCTICLNAGRYGYLPNKDELASLHYSITSGRMRKDLTTAELYERCNYRETYSKPDKPNWWYIWSSTECECDSFSAYNVCYVGYVLHLSKSIRYYVIPFFKF